MMTCLHIYLCLQDPGAFFVPDSDLSRPYAVSTISGRIDSEYAGEQRSTWCDCFVPVVCSDKTVTLSWEPWRVSRSPPEEGVAGVYFGGEVSDLFPGCDKEIEGAPGEVGALARGVIDRSYLKATITPLFVVTSSRGVRDRCPVRLTVRLPGTQRGGQRQRPRGSGSSGDAG